MQKLFPFVKQWKKIMTMYPVTSLCRHANNRDALDLPESETRFQIMISKS